MQVTINPITERLKEVVKKHGAPGWVVLRNDSKCNQREGKRASLVIKNNLLLWLTDNEVK